MAPQHCSIEGEYPSLYQHNPPQPQIMLAPTSQPRHTVYGNREISQVQVPVRWSMYSNLHRQQSSVNQGAWQGQHVLSDPTILQNPASSSQATYVSQVTSDPTSASAYHDFLPAGFSYENVGRNAVGAPTMTQAGSSTLSGGISDLFDRPELERNRSSRSTPSLVYKTDPDQSSLEGDANHGSPNSAWESNDTTSYAPIKRCPSFEYNVGLSDFAIAPSQLDPGAVELMNGPYFQNNRTQEQPSMQLSPQNASQWNQTDWANARNPMSWPAADLAYQPTLQYPEAIQTQNNMYLQRFAGNTRAQEGSLLVTPSKNAQPTSDLASQTASHMTVSTPVVRKREDIILLEGKRRGLTYKEIRKKLGTNVAESTLRGRYRSLTKARKDRVRKPVWTENDIRLLEQIVLSELDRLNAPSYRHSSEEQRLSKISWKRVADYITQHGGSYHFGNSTCKKKWTELVGEGDNA